MGYLKIGWIKSCLLNEVQSFKLGASFHVVLQSSEHQAIPLTPTQSGHCQKEDLPSLWRSKELLGALKLYKAIAEYCNPVLKISTGTVPSRHPRAKVSTGILPPLFVTWDNWYSVFFHNIFSRPEEMSREEQGKEKPFDAAKEVICMQSCLALSPGF